MSTTLSRDACTERFVLNSAPRDRAGLGHNARVLLEEFTGLHDRYTALVKANLAMETTFLLLSVFERPEPS